MNFDSLAYLAFLPAVYLLYRALSWRGQNLALLTASFVFYGCWDPRFLLLIIASTAMDFCAALLIERGRITALELARLAAFVACGALPCTLLDWKQVPLGRIVFDPSHAWALGLLGLGLAAGGLLCLWLPTISAERRRRVCLILSLTGNLGLLAFFKYANFLIDSAGELITLLGGDPAGWHLDIVLPVGISFYTFQTMSYTIDVYRGNLAACDRIVPFALFVTYFPQLVAGPIERATHLLPLLSSPRRLSWQQSTEGLYLILFGLFKKVAIANGVAPAVNSVYSSAGAASAIDIAAATVLFAVQIFGDFSGYSDIARGTSKLFGIELMRNFRVPYAAKNPSEFWQRWHVSLSSWLRDYLYIPLGGNRGAARVTYRNLMLTMLFGGLWHGAAWNFVLWGAFHGAILCVHRFMVSVWGRPAAGSLRVGFTMVAFFGVTCYGWLLFRAESFAQIASFTSALLTGAGGFAPQIARPTLAAMLGLPLMIAIEVLDYRVGLSEAYRRTTPMQRGLFLAATSFLLLMGASNAPQQFIYFQF